MRHQIIAASCGALLLTFFFSPSSLLSNSFLSNDAFAQNAGDAPEAKPEVSDEATPEIPQDAEEAPPEIPVAEEPAKENATGTSPVIPSEDSEAPVNIRLRQLEQRVQALKERAWRAKARVGMLKEAVIGGGIGARAGITHENDMGNSYRLLKLSYALDGTQVYTRADPSGAMHDQKNIDILNGPIAPGSHTITVVAEYRGNGYGVFRYLNKYRFKVRSSHTFTASEGKAISIRAVAFEKGGVTTSLEDRPAIEFKVAVAQGTK